ncbi:hypothetical protein NOR51B_770 [Luminiphilus syltensis NOR5-1B]|uniref:Uncharacterized protein n=1 Tax=Luminiphilus syltensis NOR5-1B TaxID=565045 RepID=B8KRC3_9GAMM|nr:hypothetical protein NOR51B_770 [Luminiphilus syltensis NOR5-1B]
MRMGCGIDGFFPRPVGDQIFIFIEEKHQKFSIFLSFSQP